jgi:uncharacterized protein (DUF1800 family)
MRVIWNQGSDRERPGPSAPSRPTESRPRRQARWLAAVLFCSLVGCGGGGSGHSNPAGSGAGGVSSGPTSADTVRFLEQASFGPTDASVAQVRQQGFAAYIDAQEATPSSGYPGYVYMDPNAAIGCPAATAPATCTRDNYSAFPVQTQFFRNAIAGPDQLRQRVAFALSQIFVVSGLEIYQPYALAAYQQTLLDDAFANYRKLLEDVTLSPAMGRFLDMVNNDKADPTKGISPNENYAREVLQLFSIGLVQLNDDGTPRVDGTGTPIPTYDQTVIEGFAYAFTGWTFPTRPGATAGWPNPAYYLGRMLPVAAHHDPSGKTLLDGRTLPAGQTAEADLAAALDTIAAHRNVGPFIGRQLIQHLVTSNPSPAYVGRIAAVFADNGHGVRGDLGAVVKAILLDPEARGDAKSDPTYGKLREPVLALTGLIRGIGGASASDGVYLRAVSAAMSQNVFDAPSVFNYYPPDYPVPGGTGVSPPLAIYGATTSLVRANVVGRLLAASVTPDATVPGAIGTSLDTTSWQVTASDPAALSDRIDQRFFHGAMTPSVQNVIAQRIAAIQPSDPENRAKIALYLALTSDQYQVQQ